MMVGIQVLEGTGDLDELQHELIGIAQSNGETLLSMIGDLLDVEKMESGSLQLDYEELSAADLVAAAIGQVASLVKGKNLTLIWESAASLPAFKGDGSKLLRALVNLLGNAIKFTSSGGTVTVKVRESDDRQMLVFSVSDTGEGIPSSAFDQIFEKFGQVESRKSGRKMSTGLGLAFCKLAVTAHGGRISVESVPDVGSTFSFTIPFS
jgi:signal transduction histidine kinase